MTLIDATSVINPYAADLVRHRVRIKASHPAEHLARYVGVPVSRVTVTNGAREALKTLLTGRVLLSLPTCPAYYELVQGPVVVNQLSVANDFRLDLDALERRIERFKPQTVLIANPNNPDGGTVGPAAIVDFLARTKAPHVVVDETFAAFAGAPTLAHLVDEFPHLTVVGSLRPSHAMQLGYVVSTRKLPQPELHDNQCAWLDEPHYQSAHAAAHRAYVRDTRAFQAALTTLPGAKSFASRANFSLLTTYLPASDVIAALRNHGILVRGCAEQWVLNTTRYVRVSARSADENAQILCALRQALTIPLALAA